MEEQPKCSVCRQPMVCKGEVENYKVGLMKKPWPLATLFECKYCGQQLLRRTIEKPARALLS